MVRTVVNRTNAARESTLTVAANDATTKSKFMADYVCDGVNDHLQINAAIAELGTTGGDIKLTEGTFICSNSILPTSKVHLHGSGFATTVKTLAHTATHLISIPSKTDVIISDLNLNGDSTNQSYSTYDAQSLININQSENVILRDLHLEYGIQAGICYTGSTANYKGLSVSNCFINNCYHGIVLGSYGEYCRIDNCNMKTNSLAGIYVYGAGNATITNCSVSWTTHDGVYVDTSVGINPNRIIISNCRSNHNGDNGFNIYKSQRVTLSNCNAVANTKAGILLDGTKLCSVMGGFIGANSITTEGAYDEITLSSITDFPAIKNIIQGVIIDSYNVGYKAAYSINEADENCDYNLFLNNTGTPGATGAINKQGVNSVDENNILT